MKKDPHEGMKLEQIDITYTLDSDTWENIKTEIDEKIATAGLIDPYLERDVKYGYYCEERDRDVNYLCGWRPFTEKELAAEEKRKRDLAAEEKKRKAQEKINELAQLERLAKKYKKKLEG